MKRLALVSSAIGWLFLGGALFLGLRPGGTFRQPLSEWASSKRNAHLIQSSWDDLSRRRTAIGGRGVGAKGVLFLDYRCMYCRTLHDSISQALSTTNNVRIVMRYLVREGTPSHLAAAAAICAAQDGRFREMHSYLMTDKTWLENVDGGVVAAAVGLREKTGWEECLTSPTVEDILIDDTRWAEALNIDQTPTLLTESGEVLTGTAAIAAWVIELSDENP